MPQSRQARKRVRQNEKLNLRNRSVKNEIKTLTKKLLEYVAAGNREAAQALAPTLVSKMDKAARRRIYHPNNVARKKSALARSLNKLALETPPNLP
jgi:small subunit ribosomal protein S20